MEFNVTQQLEDGALERDDDDLLGRNEDVAKIEIIVLSLVFVVAVVGNVGVLLALNKSRRKPSRMHLFMKHLSLADLVVAFFQVLPQLCWTITFRFYGPDFLCRIVKHLQVLGMFASTYMMVMMTLDRYIAVCHPLNKFSKKRAHIMIGSTWACSLVLSIPQYFIFSLSEVSPGSAVYDCWGHFVEPWGLRAYITWITVCIFLVPVLVLVVCYGLICRTIWNHLKYKTQRESVGAVDEATKSGTPLRVSSTGNTYRMKSRSVKMSLVIVLAFVVCWAPFFTVQMWSVWDTSFPWEDNENIFVTLFARLASLNSCCNPWIYMALSGHLLSDFARSLPCCRSLANNFVHQDSDPILLRVRTTQPSCQQGPRLSKPFRDLN